VRKAPTRTREDPENYWRNRTPGRSPRRKGVDRWPPVGVGKTFQPRTLDPKRTLFVDVEAGDLSVQDVPVDTIRIDDWPRARNLACQIGGPNPSYPPTACYSQAHYEDIGGALEGLDRYDVIFVDSISAISRLSFRWSEQQPETHRKTHSKVEGEVEDDFRF
jgi:hypothetical protein